MLTLHVSAVCRLVRKAVHKTGAATNQRRRWCNSSRTDKRQDEPARPPGSRRPCPLMAGMCHQATGTDRLLKVALAAGRPAAVGQRPLCRRNKRVTQPEAPGRLRALPPVVAIHSQMWPKRALRPPMLHLRHVLPMDSRRGPDTKRDGAAARSTNILPGTWMMVSAFCFQRNSIQNVLVYIKVILLK